MTDQWILQKAHRDCSRPMLVPPPNQLETAVNPQVKPTDIESAPFLCTECGLVLLYSILDVSPYLVESISPYSNRLWDVYSIPVECDGENCGILTPVRIIWDVQKGTYLCKKKQNEWMVDDQVRCSQNHKLRIDPTKTYEARRDYMPF